MCAKIVWAYRVKVCHYIGCFIYVDGTDCVIQEPSPFNRKWVFHNKNVAKLRYEVTISVSGDIVWVNGPLPCGSHEDFSSEWYVHF